MAAERLSYDLTARDRGASRTFDTVASSAEHLDKAVDKVTQSSQRLTAAQAKVKEASVAARRADEDLAAARARLKKVTDDANATEAQRLKATRAVEDAELKQTRAVNAAKAAYSASSSAARDHARAVDAARVSQSKAAKAFHDTADAAEDVETKTGRASRAARLFARDSERSGGAAAAAFGSVSKTVGGVRLGIGGVVKGIGVGIPVVGGLAVGMGVLAKNIFDSASRLELVDNKARIVFGSSFPELVKWSKTVSVRFGLTSREVLGLTASFADMLVPMGLARPRAAQLAKQFAGMAPVLAQWSGGQFDTAQAAEALTGALTGEYDTLQRLGIPISDALVQEEALRLGLVKGKVDTEAVSLARQRLTVAQRALNKAVAQHGRSSDQAQRAAIQLQVAQNGLEKATKGSAGEVTTAAKAQAALSLIMRGSGDAQTAFAKGQDTLAARTAAAKVQLAEMRDELIVKLTPAASKAVGYFNDNFFPMLTGIAGGFRDVREEVGPVVLGLGSFKSTAEGIGGAVAGARTELEPLGRVLEDVKLGGSGVASAVAPIGNLLIGVQGAAGGAAGALEPMGGLLRTNNRGAEEFGKKIGSALRTAVDWGFKASISVVQFGRAGANAFGDLLIGVGNVAGGLADFLDSSNTTFVGFARGAALALSVINPAAARAANGAITEFEKLRHGAADKLRGVEAKSTSAGRTLKTEVTKGADAAIAKLESTRRAALGIPDRTLTKLEVAERDAQARIAATKRQLQDPALTATRRAKLEADLRKWQDQLKQIQRDKAKAAQPVKIPTGATAVPSAVTVVRTRDKNGIVTGIRFGRSGQGFAQGGRVHGPGTGTSDSVPAVLANGGPARLSNGEHVLTAREVRGFGGHSAVERMRKHAAKNAGYVPQYAFGGPVADLDAARTRSATRSGMKAAADAAVADAVTGAMRDALKRETFNPGLAGALSFARSQAGKPYLWGGVGPGGYDCSGFMSALVNVAQGRPPYQRRFATGSLPAGLFNPGLAGAFQIGWSTNTGSGIGHTAGTINGVNVESRGGDGVVVGPRARGARAGLFGRNGSLKGFARGGAVGDPPFDLISTRGRGFHPAWPTGGDGSRARSLRRHINRGGTFYEDLSFPGMSPAYAAGVDRLAGRFWREHPRFDFGGPRTGPVVGGWLDQVVTKAIGNIRANRRHTAMARGGLITEPVMGVGLRSGGSYSFGERGPETVLPGESTGGGIHLHVHLDGPHTGSTRRFAQEVAPDLLQAINEELRKRGRRPLTG